MNYSDEEIRRAFLEDEISRYAVLATSGPQRPEFAGLALARGEVEEPVTVSDIDLSDLDSAVAELARARGSDYADVWNQVRLAAAGERDAVSLTEALIELASGSGSSADTGDHVKDVVSRNPEYFDGKGEEDEDEDGEEGRAKKARKRRRGRPGKIPESKTPESMGVGTEAASGDVQAAARQRWARAGVVGLSEDDEIELELASSDAEGGPVEEILRRHGEYFGHGGFQRPSECRERPGRASYRAGPVSTATRAHSEDEDPSDRRQPHRGGETHPEVDRYLGMLHQGGFGGREEPHGSVTVHRRAR